jgi:cation diffusion facilitator family transporter
MNGEIKALLISTIAAIALGAIALIVALMTGSGAILLDAVFNLCFFATALFTLRIARLLKRPDDQYYPFGYLHFEPLINMVKGLLIFGVGLFALVDAAIAMYHGGTAVSAGNALIYAIFATAHCAVTLWVLRRAERQVPSPLIRGDVDNWAVNLAISIGMVVAFCLALLLQRLEMEGAAKLVDPILVSLVVLLTIVVPIRMCWDAILALLKRAPDTKVVTGIETLISQALGDLPVRGLFTRVVQPGRTLYALVHVLLGEEQADMDVRRMDELRRAAVAAVVEQHAPIILDIVFTAIDEFAIPTTGFNISHRSAVTA